MRAGRRRHGREGIASVLARSGRMMVMRVVARHGRGSDYPERLFFFRMTLPQHFCGTDNRGHAYKMRAIQDKDEKWCVDYGVDTEPHWTNTIAKHVFQNSSSIVLLDYNEYLEHRGDLHSLGNRHDCTHWCWDYEMWRGIFYLKYAAI
jgi:hypothetical protein